MPACVRARVNNLAAMTYTSAEAREQMLETIAGATDEIAFALASLGEVYEQLDENTADTLEVELFRPVQLAYGRAQRTYTEFAARHEMPARSFQPASAGAPSQGVRGLLDSALDAIARVDAALAALQDSMLPIEAGDAELRAGLEEVRRLLGDLRGRARELVRTFGR